MLFNAGHIARESVQVKEKNGERRCRPLPPSGNSPLAGASPWPQDRSGESPRRCTPWNHVRPTVKPDAFQELGEQAMQPPEKRCVDTVGFWGEKFKRELLQGDNLLLGYSMKLDSTS
ncbi:MAG: hypothetical protein OXC82_13095, partial [Rhodobacteraceae bacterium]|nr:hypothetical protein [Paracoccaceae bacterium]